MEYDIVTLEQKTIAGVCARTGNQEPDMEKVIGGLWENFYSQLAPTLPGKLNEKTFGLYTEYQGEHYTVMVGCEIEPSSPMPEGVCTKIIPAGCYARFIVRGNVQKDVAAFWEKLWNMDLERKFTCDFEEYQPGTDMNHAVIHIYIALKESKKGEC